MRWLLLGLLSLHGTEAHATDVGEANSFGLGVILVHPTGLSGKYYLGGRTNAVDAALAYAGDGRLYAHAGYLWHPSVLVDEGAFEIPWHVGVGGVITTWRGWAWGREWRDHRRGDLALAVRVPVGIDFDLREFPLQFFGDITPEVFVFPFTDVRVGLSLGARYYF